MPARVIHRDSWSRMGFILASIGAAVGVGNIWRFPYMVGINGGGAFLIPYLVGVVAFSVPLMVLELDAGRHFRGSVISVMGRISRRYRLAGLLPLSISLGVAGYYLVVTGWSLAYFTFSLTGYIPFAEFTSSLMPLLFFIVSLAITSVIVSFGIKRGIEKASLVLMPVFALLLVSLAAYSVTLPGAGEGIAFYLTPDFSCLADMNIWVMGIIQSFFSLAVGYGILITYASYLPKDQKVASYAVGIAGADTLIALAGGLIVFPIVFSFGLDPATGSGLTFLSLPLVFQSMPLGFLVGAAFFLLLFVAGLTSAVGFFEVGSSSLVDELSWSRRRSSLVLSMVIACVGVPASLTFFGSGLSVMGQPLIEFLDLFFGKMLLLSAALTSFLITRHYRPQELSGGGLFSRTVLFALRYAIPLALIAMLVFTMMR
jgi:NSS family neurotransmitter:Na+ symporter